MITIALNEQQLNLLELVVVTKQVDDRLDGRPIDVILAEIQTEIRIGRVMFEARRELQQKRRELPVTDHDEFCGCDHCWDQKMIDTEPLEIDRDPQTQAR